MFIKGYLNPYLMRLFYHSKNIGILFWIPVFVFIFLIPFLNYLAYTRNGIDEDLYLNIIRYGQWLMPFFSVWHVIFILRESVEAEGYELFYMTGHRLKITDVLGIFGISLIFITLLFMVYGLMLPNMWLEYLRILSICFLFLGIVYGVTYWFKSITPTILILILYVFGTTVMVNHDPVFLLFYTLEVMSWQLFLSHYLILVVMGGLFFMTGHVASKKYG